jgi:uncharacterized repeat protein (TIGR01451 family)
MDRRHTTSLRAAPAWALAWAVAAALPAGALAQLPGMPSFPAPPPQEPVEALPAPKNPGESPSRREPTASRPIRPSAPVDAPRDPAVERVADDANPLGPAKSRAGSPATPAAKADGPVDGYGLPPDRIPTGRQAVGLTVEVVAPEIMNIGQTKTVKIIVRNTGVADASAVRVYYTLPKELAFVSAQPEAKQAPDEPGKFAWMLNTLAAGSEQVLAVKVKPQQTGTIDHTSTVSLMVGARSHSTIQEPLLKVEQVVTPAKVLKGQPVEFRITVRNPGTGPARDVTIQAKLSSGLKSSGDQVVEQTIPVIQPGETVQLDPLVADTIAGGEQTCSVTAFSDDVTQTADTKVVRSVTVLRPELALKVDGPETRYTDTAADYRVTVSNPGSAAAKNVRVSVMLPASGGALVKPLPAGAEWNKATQKLTWVIPNVEPARNGEPGKSTATVHVRLNGIGLYRVVAEARSSDLAAKDNISTSVSGMADIDLNVDERKRVLDVGDVTIFDITMKNVGTKEAKNLIVSADLQNVDVQKVSGIDSTAEAVFDDKTGKLKFPAIESLTPGRELNLSILVKATKPGTAKCRVVVFHDDIKDAEAGLEDTASARITSDGRALK